MPEPIRLAKPKPRKATAKPAKAAKPAARRKRTWRTASVVMAAAVLALALLSGGGIIALSQLRGGTLADLAADPTPSASPTEAPSATASPSPTPEPTPSPRATRTARATATPAPAGPDGTWTYVVEDFDSISAIASRYGTTTEAVLDLNPQYRDNPDHVVSGDVVVLPCTSAARAEGRCP